MDTDDLEPRQGQTVALSKQDLSNFSIEDLEERIAELKAEIVRCESVIQSKQGSRQDAESFFKK